jgi:hypothetical protein
MFTSKRTAAPVAAKKATKPEPTKVKTKSNAFVQAAQTKAAETLSGNGALKYSTTNDMFVDEFSQAGSMKKPRTYPEIEKSASTLWGVNPKLSVAFILYLRVITRIVSFWNGEKTTTVQRGQGLKHEAIMRMVWLHVNHKDTFWKNIQLFIAAGSWKDIFVMLQSDLIYNGWDDRKLDWNQMAGLIKAGLENPKTSELVKKYLPSIKANSVCRTIEAQSDNQVAKWLCAELFGAKANEYGNYKRYRMLKSNGTAHQWQQLISKGLMDQINFDTVHGRALALLVSGKFIKNNKLEARYSTWIASKPVAKFTGYVHELFETIPSEPYKVDTVNKQFLGLVETAKKGMEGTTGMIVVRDTSGSMGVCATGTKVTNYNIAKALALFFSYLLPDGPFANTWIEFNSSASLITWRGSTPLEKWKNDGSNYVGSTNFLAAINIFCDIKKKQPLIAEDQFPSGIICISDMEFNCPGVGSAQSITTLQRAYQMLASAGFSTEYMKNFKMVFWNLQSDAYGETTGKKYETSTSAVENVFYFSGYDGATIAFLTGIKGADGNILAPKTAQELFIAAMDQELLQLVEI